MFHPLAITSDSSPAVDLVLRSTTSAQSKRAQSQSFNRMLFCDLPDCDPPIKSGPSVSLMIGRPALNRIAAFQSHSLCCDLPIAILRLNLGRPRVQIGRSQITPTVAHRAIDGSVLFFLPCHLKFLSVNLHHWMMPSDGPTLFLRLWSSKTKYAGFYNKLFVFCRFSNEFFRHFWRNHKGRGWRSSVFWVHKESFEGC